MKHVIPHGRSKMSFLQMATYLMILSILPLFGALYFYYQYNNGRYTKESNFSEISGTVINIDTERQMRGDWVIRLENNSNFYRIRPINHKIVSISKLKEKLQYGTQITLTIIPFNSGYDIMGIQAGDTVIFSTEDAIRMEKKNMMQGLIALPSAAGLLILTGIVLIIIYNVKKNKPQNEQSPMPEKRGRKRIEVNYMGNLIEVFNSPKVLFLIINGKIADTYESLIGGKIELSGIITTAEGEKTVYLKKALLSSTLHLFCEDILLVKKWVGFG